MKKLLFALLLLTSCQKNEVAKKVKQPEEWQTHEGSVIFFLYTGGNPASKGVDLYINGLKIDNYKLKYNYAPSCGSIKCFTLTDTTERWVIWEGKEVGTNRIKSGAAYIQFDKCNQVIIN